MSSKTRAARLRGSLALAAALGLAVAPTFVQAQQAPANTRKPAAQPAAPAQPQASPAPGGQAGAQQNAGPTVVAVKPEPSQATWTKVCGKDQGNGAEICYTTRDFVSDQGQPVLAAAIYDIKGGPQGNSKIVRFLMPLGLLLQPGVRFSVDQGAATPGRYAICFPNGCFAEANVKDDVINAMKKDKATINVSVQNQAGREVTFAVPADGFGKAFDGAPIDPKELESQQKKLQEELEKKSEELRNKLQQSSQGAAPGAAPAPTAAKP